MTKYKIIHWLTGETVKSGFKSKLEAEIFLANTPDYVELGMLKVVEE